MPKTNPYLLIPVIILTLGLSVGCKLAKKEPSPTVTNFEECASAGNPVMESYPRQCRHGDKTFVENIENPINFPRPNPSSTPPSPFPTICTQEVKICPDGSYVSRTGPDCEFAPCRTSSP